MSSRVPVRYAVVGLGHIAQVAVLPAFAHARENSRLVAVVSDDARKRRAIARRYRLEHAYSYDQLEECLEHVDAVYIALPNAMHADFTIRAAKAGVHVLCEKPMAVTVEECDAMIAACRRNRVKLMIAYRLHFEEANLDAVDLVRKGRIGEPKYFTSSFSMRVRPGDVRTKANLGGGTLYDIGVYCINAARYLFRAEPEEVSAFSVNRGGAALKGVDESTAAVMRFSGERVAAFVTSFNAADVAEYRVVGTKGQLHVDPAYEYAAGAGLFAPRRRQGHAQAARRSAISSRPSCCTSRTASSGTGSRNPRAKRVARTCGSCRPCMSRRTTGLPVTVAGLPRRETAVGAPARRQAGNQEAPPRQGQEPHSLGGIEMPATETEPRTITRQELAKKLNEDLAREYQAIIAYVVYSQALKGARVHEHRQGAGDPRRRGAAARDRDRQADRLPGRDADGGPRCRWCCRRTRRRCSAPTSKTRTPTIRNYRERVRQCEELGEYACAEVIREILKQEQDHQIELATALGEDVPDVSKAVKPLATREK